MKLIIKFCKCHFIVKERSMLESDINNGLKGE